jgi:hypothetical protein
MASIIRGICRPIVAGRPWHDCIDVPRGWRHGFNGGPSHNPAMRLNDNEMNSLRQALIKAGLKPTDEPNHFFLLGRHAD